MVTQLDRIFDAEMEKKNFRQRHCYQTGMVRRYIVGLQQSDLWSASDSYTIEFVI